MTGQVQLFPAPRTLEESLGREVFDSMPKRPGIYRFYDASGGLLYVGKAANLRIRLASYRRARAGRVPRKTGELVSRIRRIETEVHASASEALLAENRWIRAERPPYNHANKHTETYYYVLLDVEADAILFRLTMNPDRQEPPMHSFGCFKGHIRVRSMLGSLLRLLWLAVNGATSPHRLPVQLTRRIAPLCYRLEVPGPFIAGDGEHTPRELYRRPGYSDDANKWMRLISDWFNGHSAELASRLAVVNAGFAGKGGFNRLFMDDAIDCINRFYHGILLPHKHIRENLLGGFPTIDRDRLDDLLVEWSRTGN